MELDDLSSLIELAQHFAKRTPVSFQTKYLPLLFGNVPATADDDALFVKAICLTVTVDEILESQASLSSRSAGRSDDIRFLVVDCRPVEEYNSGHLNTAFFLDAQPLINTPTDFHLVVEVSLCVCVYVWRLSGFNHVIIHCML